MASAIKIIIGLFIWFILPSLLNKGIKRKPIKKFVSLSCIIIGLVVVIYGIMGFLDRILHFEL